MKEQQNSGLICFICKQNHKQQWLWLPINAEECSVCLDCAVQNKYYCNKHNRLTLDLDDGKCCTSCVDVLISEANTDRKIINQVYTRLSVHLTGVQKKSLAQWVKLARLTWDVDQAPDKFLYKARSLQWLIFAKAQRVGISVNEVEEQLRLKKNLSYLIPFLPNITIDDLLGLRSAIERMAISKEKKGKWGHVPECYLQFQWHLIVARLKRDFKTQIQKTES